ncbi:MAG TPA: proton-conducting transporter membrane subunit [Chloroflexia bacterium]|nr:proton-conducting transporter membrane subunit [Chloroflexia bacterium]
MQFTILALPFIIAVVAVLLQASGLLTKVRFSRFLAVIFPVLTLTVEAVLIWQPAANSEDGAFVFSPLARIFLTILFVFTGVALMAAYATGFLQSGRFSPATLAVCGTLIAALYITNTFLVTLFFVLAGFFSIVAVVDVDRENEERFVRAVKAGVRYLVATVLFGLALFIALIFLERLRLDPQLTGLIKVVVALAVVGFAMRLAIFPFNLWLPEVVEEAPGLTNFVVLGLINVAAVAFLVDFLQKNPTLLFDNYAVAQPVMVLGLAGAVFSGLMALGQNGFGKMLAYTVSGDFGLILFGLASPHRTGLNGALYEAANLALMQLLIFTCLSVVYYCTGGIAPGGLTGLGRRTPVAAIGLLVGFMGMVGIPFLSGFAGKYLILQSAAQEGLSWVLAAGFALFLFVAAYLRYFHRLFMGNDVPGLKTLPEPPAAIALILLLVLLVIALGLWPAPALSWFDSALRTIS